MQEFFELLDDYVVFDQRAFRLPDSPPVFMGKDAVIEMLHTYWGTFMDYRMEAEDIRGRKRRDRAQRTRTWQGSGVPLGRGGSGLDLSPGKDSAHRALPDQERGARSRRTV